MSKKEAAQKAETAIADATAGLLGAVTSSVKEIAKNSGGTINDALTPGTAKLFKQLRENNEVVSVNIYRKNRQGKMALFHQLQGMSPKDLERRGLDAICKEEGGAGEYLVKVSVPGTGENFEAGPFYIEGSMQLPVPQSVLANQDTAGPAIGFGAPVGGGFVGLPGFGAPVQSANQTSVEELLRNKNPNDNVNMKDIMGVLGKQNENFMGMMQNNQALMLQASQAAQQNMMGMFAAIIQGLGGNRAAEAARPAESAESLALKQKLEAMERALIEQQKAAEAERARRMEDLITDLKHKIEISKVEGNQKANSGTENLLVQFLASQQAIAMKQLELSSNQPSKSDEVSNLLGVVSGVMGSQYTMMSELIRKQAEESNGDPSWKQMILHGLESLTNLGVAALSRGKNVPQLPGMGQDEEEEDDEAEYEELPPRQLPPQQMPPPQRLSTPPAPQPQMDGGFAGYQREDEPIQRRSVAPPPPARPSQAPPPAKAPDADIITQKELQRIERDSALARAVASLLSGDPPHEAVVRIHRHWEQGKNEIAGKWLRAPFENSEAVLTYFGQDIVVDKVSGKRRSEELAENIIQFAEYLEKGGEPSAWVSTTYTSSLRSESKKVSSESEVAIIEEDDTPSSPASATAGPTSSGEDYVADEEDGEDVEEDGDDLVDGDVEDPETADEIDETV